MESLLALQLALADISSQNSIIVDRNRCFESILGISEQEFKKRIIQAGGTAWRGNTVLYAQAQGSGIRFVDMQNFFGNDGGAVAQSVSAWRKSSPDTELNRAFDALPKEYTVTEISALRQQCSKLISGSPKQGTFSVIYRNVHDQGGYHANIRYLQAAYAHPPQKQQAIVQIASNFNALEGGIGNYDYDLKHMNVGPVQGEDAVLATPAGAIYRRYCVGPTNLLQGWSLFCTLNTRSNPIITSVLAKPLQLSAPHTGAKATVIAGNAQPFLAYDIEWGHSNKELRAMYFQRASALASLLSVGIHNNVPVTSCYPIHNGQNAEILHGRIPAFDYRVLDDQNQAPLGVIDQIFVSGIDLRLKDLLGFNNEMWRPIEALAPVILYGMYEGTLLAAWNRAQGEQRILFLTLVGAGVFGNKIEWIIDTLAELVPLIKVSNLDVRLIIYDPRVVAKVQGHLDAIPQQVAQYQATAHFEQFTKTHWVTVLLAEK